MAKKKKSKLAEKQIENAILTYLSFLPHCFAWKNNTTGVYDPTTGKWRKSKNRHAINGVSDILGVYKGQALAIEVKAPTKKASKDQENFLDTFKKNGGLCGIAMSVNDARNILKACEEDEEEEDLLEEEQEEDDINETDWIPKLRSDNGKSKQRNSPSKGRKEEA